MPPKKTKKDPKMSSEPSNVKEKEKEPEPGPAPDDPVNPIFGTSILPEDYGKHNIYFYLSF